MAKCRDNRRRRLRRRKREFMREKLFFLITPDVLKEIYKAAKNASISMGKVNEAIKEVRASLPQYKDTYTTHIVNPDQKVRIHLVD